MTESHQPKHLIEQAMKALENSNLDEAWHYMRRAHTAVHAVAAGEREACALWLQQAGTIDGKRAAEAIRARGNQ